MKDTFKLIRKHSSLNFEIHLMVANPFDYINNYDYGCFLFYLYLLN